MELRRNTTIGASALAKEIIVIDPIVKNEPNHKLRVAAYARVSSDSEDQLNSFAAQVSHYTELFNSNADWEVVDIYTDESITGTRADTRVDFQRMISDCRKGKIDRILTKSVSRFARNTKDCLETLRELATLSITVYFEKENIDTSETPSEFIITLFSSGAQEESYSISSNMRWSYQQRMKSGTFVASSTPYGYKLQERKLTVVPDQAEIVRSIFASYLGGKGLQMIVNELNATNIPCKHENAKWSIQSVVYVLKNERYIGDSVFQKSFTSKTLPFTKIVNNGEKDRYYIANSHDSIISRNQFEQTRILMKYRNEKYAKKARSEHVLKGKIWCENCNTTFKRKEIRGNFYWCCHSHNNNKDICPITPIPETEILKAFTVLHNKLELNCSKILVPMFEQLQALKTSRNQSNTHIFEINKDIANLTEQNYVLSGIKSKGYIDSALFISQTNEISRQIANLKAEKNRLLASFDEDAVITKTQYFIELLTKTLNNHNSFNQEIFNEVVEKIIIISNEKIRFCLINGLELNESIERTVRK